MIATICALTALSGVPLQANAYPTYAYNSAGDSQFNRHWLPVDSPATVRSFISRLSESHGVSRLFWRGEQNRTILQNAKIRPESLQFGEYWLKWQKHLAEKDRINEVAVETAHRYGMKIYSQEGWLDLGGSGAAGFSTLPYPFEYKLRIQHPEWLPVDKYGLRRQDGPIEFCYPGARKALVNILASSVKNGGYDGLLLYSYFENFGTRYEDEFGFNQPIVNEYKRRYGADIRTQDFDRTKWANLRGEYATTFLKELKKALGNIKLSVALSAKNPNTMQEFPLNSGRVNSSMTMDWKTWIRSGTVDEIAVMGGTVDQGRKFANQLVDAGCKSVTMFVENVDSTVYDDLRARGVVMTAWSAPVRSQFVEKYTLAKVTERDVQDQDWKKRAQATYEFGAKLPINRLISLTRDEEPYVRREAFNQIEARKDSAAESAAQAALNDPEESVRVAAVATLGYIGSSRTAYTILSAISDSSQFMFKEAAVEALRKLGRPAWPAVKDALTSNVAAKREIATRVGARVGGNEARSYYLDLAGNDPSPVVRTYAIEELGIEFSPEYLKNWNAALEGRSGIVRAAAIRAFRRAQPVMPAEFRLWALYTLEAQFRDCIKYDEGEWLWRLIGTSLASYGPDGEARLVKLMAETDAETAKRAFQVRHLGQKEEGYVSGSAAKDKEEVRRAPPGLRKVLGGGGGL